MLFSIHLNQRNTLILFLFRGVQKVLNQSDIKNKALTINVQNYHILLPGACYCSPFPFLDKLSIIAKLIFNLIRFLALSPPRVGLIPAGLLFPKAVDNFVCLFDL